MNNGMLHLIAKQGVKHAFVYTPPPNKTKSKSKVVKLEILETECKKATNCKHKCGDEDEIATPKSK